MTPGQLAAPAVSTATLRAAARLLQAGGLVAFPTETVYGLGADAANPAAIAAVFALKGRPADHPLIVHLALPTGPVSVKGALDSADRPDAAAWRALLEQWARDVPDAAVQLAQRFWPGPLTLILRKQSWVPDAVTGGQPTVGLRVPDQPVALALLAQQRHLNNPNAPCGIAAPSANHFGQVSPTTAQHVLDSFAGQFCPASELTADGQIPPDLAGCVLDGGPCQVGLESTIVDLSGNAPRILRPGAVTTEQLAEVLGSASLLPAPAESAAAPRVPGQLDQHYAPQAQVIPLELDDTKEVLGADSLGAVGTAVIAPRSWLARLRLSWRIEQISLPDDLAGQARELYSALREADSGNEHIMVIMPEATGLGVAIRDRVLRAAGLGAEPADDP